MPRFKSKPGAFSAAIGFALVAAYGLILPLYQPKGVYGWGHYRLLDVVLGVPSAIAVGIVVTRLLKENSRLRQILQKLTLATLASLATLLAVDFFNVLLVKQAWRDGSASDIWFDEVGVTRRENLPHDRLGFVRKPLLFWKGPGQEGMEVIYQTDENGFRNAPHIADADILFLGDSFTEAASLPRDLIFAERTRGALGLKAVNLGRSAYGPQQELLVLKELGQAYQPRAVVWQLFEGNDLADAARYATWRDHRQSEPLKLRISKASLLVQLLSLTARTSWMTLRPFRRCDGHPGKIYLDYPARTDQVDRHPRGYEETLESIRSGLAWSTRNHAKFVVIFIPVKVRVLGSYVEFKDGPDRDSWLLSPRDERSDFGRALETASRHDGFSFIDMTAPLLEWAKVDNRQLYASGRDSHLGIQGHLVVAQELVKWFHPSAQTAGILCENE